MKAALELSAAEAAAEAAEIERQERLMQAGANREQKEVGSFMETQAE